MNHKTRLSGIIILTLAAISIIFPAMMLVEISRDITSILGFQGRIILHGIGYLFVLLFHCSALVFLVKHFPSLRTLKALPVAALIMGVFSLFAVGAEKVMFDEIGREYRSGLDISGEFAGLCFFFALNILFALLMIILIAKTFSIRKSGAADDKAEKAEAVFVIAQSMGIVSGVMGSFQTLSLILMRIPLDRLWIYLPFYALFLVPYAIAVLYWLSLKIKQKITDWYDEKQLRDMMKSALLTLLLSIPILSALFVFGEGIRFYWFPFYIFAGLTVFSSGTLYFFKNH